MPCNKLRNFFVGYLLSFTVLFATPNQFPESPGLPSLDEQGFFADLVEGDSREIVLKKLQKRDILVTKNYNPG